MSVSTYSELREHVGHDVQCVTYGQDENVSLECEDCGMILLSFDQDEGE